MGSIHDIPENEFIEKNLTLVHYVCKNFRAVGASKGYDYEDLVGIGNIGLVKAYRNFDDSRGVQWATYAVPMIQGEIRRYMRDNEASGLHFSRHAKNAWYQIFLANMLDCSKEEIAAKLDIPVKYIQMALEYNKAKYVHSLNAPVHGQDDGSKEIEGLDSQEDDSEDNEVGDPYDQIDGDIVIDQFVETLTPKQKSVWELLKTDSYTQSEMGDMIGISQVQISRITKEIFYLAQKFGEKVSKKDEPVENLPTMGSSDKIIIEEEENYMSKSLTPETAEQVKKMVADGMEPIAIAKKLGCNYTAVQYYYYKAKKEAEKAEKVKKVSGLTKAEKIRINELISCGLTIEEVCKAIDAPSEVIRKHIESIQQLISDLNSHNTVKPKSSETETLSEEPTEEKVEKQDTEVVESSVEPKVEETVNTMTTKEKVASAVLDTLTSSMTSPFVPQAVPPITAHFRDVIAAVTSDPIALPTEPLSILNLSNINISFDVTANVDDLVFQIQTISQSLKLLGIKTLDVHITAK